MEDTQVFSAVDTPAGIYVVYQREPLPSSTDSLGIRQMGQRLAKAMRRSWLHQSIYVRGWFFDITSDLAETTSASLFLKPLGNLVFRARHHSRTSSDTDANGDNHRYFTYRLGTTVVPLWLLFEIGRRVTSAMDAYVLMDRNCHTFATSFAVCALQPGTLGGIKTIEPAFMNDSRKALDEWDARFQERLKRGDKPRIWKGNTHGRYLMMLTFMRYLVWARSFAHEVVCKGHEPPKKKHDRNRLHSWQEEIHTLRIFTVTAIVLQDADPTVADILVESTIAIPLEHMLLLPADASNRPDPEVITEAGLELAANELLMLRVPALSISILQLKCDSVAAAALTEQDGTQAYVISYSQCAILSRECEHVAELSV